MAMSSGQMLLFSFLIILVHFAYIITTQVPGFLYYLCTNSANYTTNSTYQSNLETVLPSLPSNTINNCGFYNTFAGQGPDIVNAIAICSGDMSRDICRSCVSNATLKRREVCPNQMAAIGWYVRFLYVSNASIFNSVGEGETFYLCNSNNVSSLGEFNAALRSLTDKLQEEAAAGGTLWKYAMGNITGPDFLTIYGLMKCTPDLSEAQCHKCLYDATTLIPSCCNGRQGGRIVGSSGNLGYETYSFYNEIPAISLPSPPPPSAPPSRAPPPLPPTSQSPLPSATYLFSSI